MKKLLLGLGTLAAVAAPVAAVVACGSGPTKPGTVKSFKYTQGSTKASLTTFLLNNKGKKVEVDVDGQELTFISNGVISNTLNTIISGGTAPDNKDTNPQTKQNPAIQKQPTETPEAKVIRELKEQTEKVAEAAAKIDSSDIANKIKSIKDYDDSTDASSYAIPNKIQMEEDGITFDVTASNVVIDGNGGQITLTASVTNSLLDAPISNFIRLSGFKTVLDAAHKVQKIQEQLDANPLYKLSTFNTSSKESDGQLIYRMDNIVTNNYGVTPTISNVVRTSGKATFDISYEIGDSDGNKVTATKSITLTGYVTDSDEALTLQKDISDLKSRYTSVPNDSQDLIAEDDSRVGGPEFEVSQDDMKKFGLDLPYAVSSTYDDKVKVMGQISDDLKISLSVIYNGTRSVVRTQLEVWTLEKRNFYNKAKQRGKKLNDMNLATETLDPSFKFPKGLTELPDYAFAQCSIPTGFKMPEGITSIGSYAFSRTVVADGVKLPSTLTKIGYGAFQSATIPGSMSIPSGVEEFGSLAFDGAKIGDNFKLPKHMNKIGIMVFNDAIIGKNFTMPEILDEIEKQAFLGAAFGNGIVMPKEIKNVKLSSIFGASSVFESATLPSHIDVSKLIIDKVGSKTPTLPGDETISSLFDGRRATSDAKIPDYVTTLTGADVAAYRNTFGTGASLPTGFVIPNNIKVIGRAAFDQDILPAGFTLPESIVEIGDEAFIGAVLPASFRLPSHLETIGIDAFSWKYKSILSSVKHNAMPKGFTIPDSVISIGDGAFAWDEFQDGFTIGSGVKNLGHAVFGNTKFASDFKLPSTVEKLTDEPFVDSTTPADFKSESKAHDVITSTGASKSIYDN